MILEQKRIQLERYKKTILLSLEYLIETDLPAIIFDDYSPICEYYQQQKLQVEKYFNLHRLDLLKRQLSSLTKILTNRSDVGLREYIRVKTGDESGLYEDLLQLECMKRGIKMARDNHSTSIKGIEEDGITTFQGISMYPKPKHFVEEQTISPDGSRTVVVTQWGDGKNASTYVTIHLNGVTGTIYATDTICKNVKAFWKDNNNILLEIGLKSLSTLQYSKIQCRSDIIKIQYKEFNNEN